MCKSKLAFQMSVENLFRDNSKVYMWTLTFTKAKGDDHALYCWNQVSKKIQDHFPACRGLRVTERHPGEVLFGDLELSHGLHFHLLVNLRLPIHWLDRVGRKWGFGFKFARHVSLEDALYCGKYLSKTDGKELKKGGRKWGSIGGYKAVRVNDIEINSPFHRNFRLIQKRCRITQVTPDVLHSIYLNTELHGPLENWPNQLIQYGGRSRELLTPEMLGFPVKSYADPTRKRLTRVNPLTKQQRMEKRAKVWKALCNQRQRRVESETKPSEKIFTESPRGCPGAAPVKNQDTVPRGTVYYLDKIPRKWAGMSLAEEKVWWNKLKQVQG